MGMTPRRRSTDKHLPPRVYRKHGAYYFVPPPAQRHLYGKAWVPLGKHLPEALAEYARLLEGNQSGTVAELWRLYERRELPHNAARTRDDKRAYWQRLAPVFGHCHPDDVRPIHIAQYLDKRADAGAGQSANKEIALLSHIYTKAVSRWGMAQANPCKGVERISRPQQAAQYVTDAQLVSWLNFATRRLSLFSELLYMTGLRPGDALRLRLEDVAGDTLLVRASKTGKAAERPITPALRAVIDELRAVNTRRPTPRLTPYLVANRSGDAYTVGGFNSQWQREMRDFAAAGGERFPMKALRAKYASDLEALGEDATRNLQHSSRAVTERHYLGRPATVVVLGRIE